MIKGWFGPITLSRTLRFGPGTLNLSTEPRILAALVSLWRDDKARGISRL